MRFQARFCDLRLYVGVHRTLGLFLKTFQHRNTSDGNVAVGVIEIVSPPGVGNVTHGTIVHASARTQRRILGNEGEELHALAFRIAREDAPEIAAVARVM